MFVLGNSGPEAIIKSSALLRSLIAIVLPRFAHSPTYILRPLLDPSVQLVGSDQREAAHFSRLEAQTLECVRPERRPVDGCMFDFDVVGHIVILDNVERADYPHVDEIALDAEPQFFLHLSSQRIQLVVDAGHVAAHGHIQATWRVVLGEASDLGESAIGVVGVVEEKMDHPMAESEEVGEPSVDENHTL